MTKRRSYKKECLWCNKDFYPFSQSGLLCSNRCSGLWRTRESRYKKTCLYCKKSFVTRIRRNQFFCTRDCYIKQKSKETKFLKCIICNKQFLTRGIDLKRGRKYCSNKCMGIAYSSSKKGSNNPMFKDGKNKERLMERDSCRSTIEYKRFVRKVFIRDKNCCQKCGVKRKRTKDGKGKNNNLTVHHIKSWKDFPKLRYVVKNGLTLCKDCHIKEHRRLQ